MAIRKDFKLLKIIQKLELFAHLTVEDAQVVLSLSESKTYELGDIVFRAREAPHFFVVVVSGQLRLDETIYTTDPGESNGAINALTRQPHWFTVSAASRSAVLAFEILSIRTLKSSHPSLYGKILERALELAGKLLTEHMDLTNPT